MSSNSQLLLTVKECKTIIELKEFQNRTEWNETYLHSIGPSKTPVKDVEHVIVIQPYKFKFSVLDLH
jgi:hypothetical protein